MHRGFAKVYRKFLEWEWYDDIPAKTVYLHCLLKANHVDKKYRGTVVRRGTFLTSREKLSSETGLTIQQVRTCLAKLSAEYVTIKPTKRGTLISVVDFETYNGDNAPINQPSNPCSNHQSTSEQPTSNQQVTTTKKLKERKERKESITTIHNGFDEFWNAYPKKIGKKAALKAWKNAKDKPPISELVVIVESHKKTHQWTKMNGQYVPNPSTWLNQGNWSNDIGAMNSGCHNASAWKSPDGMTPKQRTDSFLEDELKKLEREENGQLENEEGCDQSDAIVLSRFPNIQNRR